MSVRKRFRQDKSLGQLSLTLSQEDVVQISWQYPCFCPMLLEKAVFLLNKISKWPVTPTFFLKNVFSWTRSSGRVKIRMFMFKIPDFSLAPGVCKQAGLDLVSARKDFDSRTLVLGDLRHFDTTVRCAARYAAATLRTNVQVTNVTFSLEIRLCRALCGNETPCRHNRLVSILDSTSCQTATAWIL